MKRQNLILTVLFSVLGVLLLAYFILNSKDEKRYQWRETYRINSDQPYGTLFIRQLLESYKKDGKFIVNDKKPLSQLLDSIAKPDSTDYVFIGEGMYMDSTDRDALLGFIASGHDAFIASSYLPLELLDSIYINECNRNLFLEDQQVDTAMMNFYHPALHTATGYQFRYRDHQARHLYPWRNLNRDIFCDSSTYTFPLGYLAPDLVNFCKFPYGDGNLYLHTNPIAFTNYFLTKPDKAAYAASVFSHLKGKSIIWDEFSKSPYTGESEPETNPLAYILQHESLKYAWWLMLLGAALYTLFTAKRKQRAIPVLEEKVNTSLEYVKMISALHFENGNHQDIAQKKMKYFLYFIRAKYGLHTNDFTESHFKRLSEKSKVEEKNIKVIFNQFHEIENNVFNAQGAERLVSLYNSIDFFYKHCK
ncbi:MAG: DUF4350 domain-containing protein [Chryseolinea sp.]